jgi:maltose alpha-D-glucosyltransferase/alpha-amylase
MAHSSSLLHWVKAMLEIRRRHPVFGRGEFEVCPSDNDGVLAFLRVEWASEDDAQDTEAVLCVNNLSSRPQATTIRVPDEFKGAQAADLFGGLGFPKISDDGTVTLTLGSRDFFWLRLAPAAARG